MCKCAYALVDLRCVLLDWLVDLYSRREVGPTGEHTLCKKILHKITIGKQKKILQDRSNKDVKSWGVKANGLRQGKIHLLLINKPFGNISFSTITFTFLADVP